MTALSDQSDLSDPPPRRWRYGVASMNGHMWLEHAHKRLSHASAFAKATARQGRGKQTQAVKRRTFFFADGRGAD